MNSYADKIQANKSRSVAHETARKHRGSIPVFLFAGNRPEAIGQSKLQEMANNSQQAKQTAQWQAMANNRSVQRQTILRKGNPTGSLVIQRTKWMHDGTKWNSTSSSSTDTDSFPHPSVAYPHAKKDDQYDQQT